MSTFPTFSTNDLRSASVDYKRDHEQKKWAHGVAFGPGTNAEHGRPVKPAARPSSPKRAGKKRSEHAAKQARNQEILTERFAASDSSADEEVASPMAAPTPNAEVYFSFDSHRGPSHGSQILNAALAKAIDKFESNTTDKIVKDEYDVLDHNGEVVPPMPSPHGKKGRGKAGRLAGTPALVEDDDYEFV